MNCRVIALFAVLPLCLLFASCAMPDPPPLNDVPNSSSPAITASDFQVAIHAPATTYIAVDTVPAANVEKGQTVELNGWAFAPDHSPCASVGLVIDQRRGISATYGVVRPDVAVAYEQYAFWWIGYHIAEPASALGTGEHSVFVICKTRSGALYRHPTTYAINVR